MMRTAKTFGPNLKRYRSIAMVFARHGFGSFLQHLNIARRIGLPRWTLKTKEPLAQTPAAHLRMALEELGPTFIKLGQMLTTRPDLLGTDFIRELSKLQDCVPPASWEQARAVLVQDWGKDPEQVLSWIESTPLASASLAQVYVAALEDGSEVVVKVQRPDILKTIDTDLEILKDLAVLAQRTAWGEVNRPIALVEEFAYGLHNELDYQREGRSADRFRVNFDGDETLYIPKIFWEYSTSRVLVMERIRGVKVDDISALDAAGYDRKKVALNATRLIVKEVLEDGFFHADPHAGNLVVLPDEVIGVMDFGLMGDLSERDRESLLRLFVSAAALDADGVVEELVRLSAVGTGVDRAGLSRDLNRLLTSYAGLPLKALHPVDIVDDLLVVAHHHKVVMPANMWLLSKMMVMAEGLGLKLDPEYDMLEVAGPILRRLKMQMWLPNRGWGQSILRHGAEWVDFLDILPRSSRHLLEKLEHNDPFEMELKDAGRMMGSLNRLANRLAFSILIASLIIGLAIIIPLLTAGSPVWILAVAGFLAVVGLGFWLLVSIIRGA